MSKEQIEEMARDLENHTCMSEFQAEIASRMLYQLDYRKQSEVVRCKDCEYFYQDGTIKLCRHWNCHSTEDNAYCSYAKMKGGAEE